MGDYRLLTKKTLIGIQISIVIGGVVAVGLLVAAHPAIGIALIAGVILLVLLFGRAPVATRDEPPRPLPLDQSNEEREPYGAEEPAAPGSGSVGGGDQGGVVVPAKVGAAFVVCSGSLSSGRFGIQ